MFDEIIYGTPENWGEKIFANSQRMLDIIIDLGKVSPDFKHIGLGDCEKYEFIRQLTNRTALYSAPTFTRDSRHVFPVAVFEQLENGEYDLCYQFDSEKEFKEAEVMNYYALIDNASGYLWGTVKAENPVEACKKVDADLGVFDQKYVSEYRHNLAANQTGYHVYELSKDLFLRLKDADGQSREVIDLLEKQGVHVDSFCCVDDDGDLNIYVTNDYTKNINEIDTGQGDGLACE
jgi:hypothetical protein